MKDKTLHERADLLLVSFLTAAFVLSGAGCSSHDDDGDTTPTSLNPIYYGYLSSSAAIQHPDAQVRVPPSGEFFSENTKHFDLVPAGGVLAGSSLANPKAGGFALYRPAGSNPLPKNSSAIRLAAGDEIPGFKNDNTPEECLARTGDDRLVCLDEARRKEHVSYHDGDALRIQHGGDVPGQIADLVMRSLDAHLGTADRTAIVAGLTASASTNPAHAAFSAASHDIFNKSGYAFSHAVITDRSRGDVDNDGQLDSHSTLIVEVRKPLSYQRRSLPGLDACVAKHASGAFTDEYVVSINSFVHLDYLDAARRKLVFDGASAGTNARMLEQMNAHQDARAINHALDANLLKHISANTAVLPWSASEYMLHFQLKPETASRYMEMTGIARSAGDDACADLMRSHLNPHTVIITGKDGAVTSAKAGTRKVHLFYQAPEWSPSAPGAAADFCLSDESGRKIAILDPSTGRIAPACEAGRASLRQKFTEDGACKNDQNSWSYWPSRARTPRFFTSQLILTEMLLHDQVADYWSIKWYQNGWKATGQVVVKGAGFVINTAIRIAAGQLPSVDDFGQEAALRIGVYFVNAFLPTLIDASFKNVDGFNIAGYVVKIPTALMNFALTLAKTAADNPTLITKLAGFMKGFIIGFAIDKLTSTTMQITDSMLFEWQDYSNGSHPGCFNFND